MARSIKYLVASCIVLAFCFVPFNHNGLKKAGYQSNVVAMANSSPGSRIEAIPLRGILDITFDANPVVQSSGSCNGVKPSWNFTVTLTETGGVGVTITHVSIKFFNNNSNLIQTQDLSAVDFANLFNKCGPGTNRIPAGGRACAFLCADLGGAGSGSMLLTFSGSDDAGNSESFCGGPLVLAGPNPNGQGADLSITNFNSSDSVVSGRLLLYTITVSNSGPEIATGVVVTDSTPAGTTFDSVAASQGTCKAPASGSTGTTSCLLGSIGPGGSATIWVVVNVTAAPGSHVINTARVTSTSKDPNEADNSADETTFVVSADSQGKSELTLTSTTFPETASPGGQVTYTITVKNSGPDGAAALSMIDLLPPGTTFASVTTTPATSCTAPPIGSGGAVVCGITLGSTETLTIAIKVNVVAAAGTSLSNKAEIIDAGGRVRFITCIIAALLGIPPSVDPNPNNDFSINGKSIRGGGVVKLSWDQPSPSSANPTPGPTNLRVNIGDLASTSVDLRELSLAGSGFSPSATCTLVGYNIYVIGPTGSSSPVIQLDPSKLFKTVPSGTLGTNVPVAPSGSSYQVTAVWHCSAGNRESDPSNSQSVPGGATINTVDISSQLNITGSGFTDSVDVFIDGVGFKKSARLKNSSRVLQKGALLDGRSIDQILAPGKSVLLTVRNSNGGIASFQLNAN